MISKITQRKLILPLQICTFILLAGITFSAHAEYYLVYPGSALYVGCEFQCKRACFEPCYQTPIHYFHSVSPKRHSHTGSGEMQEYQWISAP
ncbi:MAG: hypothetical protein KIT56_06775 [Gammaproteobacteria bacterium]|nr:hypothetical protein [Gammaproteobacteria bacterium]MCW5583570.1 hypothetical protein [Gammaproteobacteria bacterium]